MLKVFFGNDTVKVRARAFAEAEAAQLTIESIDESQYEPGAIQAATGNVSLFGDTRVYVIDTPSQNNEMYEEVVTNLSLMAGSADTFIVIESGLLVAEKKRFEKHAETIEELKKTAETRFNTFALADALSRKDKKSLWVLLNEARLSGIPFEELVGVLWWQLKTMRLAAKTKNAEEAGVKDYPYNKAKRALTKFKPEELVSTSHALLKLTHESRLGLYDLDHALERWILKI